MSGWIKQSWTDASEVNPALSQSAEALALPLHSRCWQSLGTNCGPFSEPTFPLGGATIPSQPWWDVASSGLTLSLSSQKTCSQALSPMTLVSTLERSHLFESRASISLSRSHSLAPPLFRSLSDNRPLFE